MTESPARAETAPASVSDSEEPTPRRRVLMSAGARTVEVEGPDELDALVYLATAIWGLTSDPAEPRLTAGGMGFAADLAAPALEDVEPDGDDQRRPVVP